MISKNPHSPGVVDRDLEQRLDAREKGEASNLMDKEGPEVLYALLGALRGDCAGPWSKPGRPFGQINWNQWAAERF